MNNKLLILGLIALTGAALFLSTASSGQAQPSDLEAVETRFVAFKVQFDKHYASLAEMDYRLAVFQSNLQLIAAHNADATATYTLGVNEFSDLTFEEFAAKYLRDDPEDNFQVGQDANSELYFANSDDNEVDWVKAGIVGEVKNQLRCGSDWAFSAISVVEEAYALFKKVPIPDLSEQELVDCSGSYGNYGCDGGFSFQGLSTFGKRE